MSGLVEHVERAEIARWEAVLVEEPSCEHPTHGNGENAYHGGRVTHWCRTECGHLGGLRCEEIAAFWRGYDRFFCAKCDHERAFVHVEL